MGRGGRRDLYDLGDFEPLPVFQQQRRQRLATSARRELTQASLRVRRYEPEEEMFRDAIRIGQFVSIAGAAPNDSRTAELLSQFDQMSTIRLLVDKPNAVADARLRAEVHAALISRDPTKLLDASRALHLASAGKPALADLSAGLFVLGRFIWASQARSVSFRKAA